MAKEKVHLKKNWK